MQMRLLCDKNGNDTVEEKCSNYRVEMEETELKEIAFNRRFYRPMVTKYTFKGKPHE